MLGTSYPSQVFLGLHFVLFGFDPVSESKVRFKLINGGGVDVGHYSPSCTHVIVGKLAYDDPVCVAARNDRKTLVTALWVDHSADIGMPVDAASVMYRPLKDLNGIPGAKNLIVCLTGYQRQDRDDIMTMVGLMGAQFSKPLVANKVTHLICYKFEGEKYELAKRLKTIKLVNHRWLEDCLKDWVLLPEDKYNKSGYELEIMAADAKDSEEEAEDLVPGQSGGRNLIKSPVSSKISTATTHKLSKSAREAVNAFPDSTAPEGSVKVTKRHETHDSFIPEYENRSDQALCFPHVDDLKISCQDSGVSRHVASGQLPETFVKTTKPRNTNVPKAVDCQDLGMPGNAKAFGAGTSEFGKLANDLGLTPESAEGLEHSDAKVNAISCSRKYIKRFSLPRNENESSGNVSGPSGSSLDDMKFVNNLETSSSKGEKASDSFPCVEGSGKGNDFIDSREPISLLPQKRTIETSTKPESKMTADAKLSIERIPSPNGITQGLKLTSLINEPPETEDHFSVGKDAIKSPESVSSKSMQWNDAHQNSAQTSVRNLSESKINGKPNIACLGMREVAHNGIETNPPNAENDTGCLYPGNKKSQNEEPTGLSTLNLCNKVTDELIRKSPRRKTVAKKCLGSRRKLGATAKQKDLISLNESSPQCDSVSCFSGCKETVTYDGKKLHTSSRIVGVETSLEQENVRKSAENAGGREFLDDETESPDNCEYELGIALDENKAELVHISKKADAPAEQKMEAIHHITKCKEAMPAKKGTKRTEQKVLEPVDSTSKVKEKNKGRKLPAGRTNKTTVAKDLMRSKEAVCEVKMDNKRKDKTGMATLEKVSLSAVQNDRSTIPTNNSENFLKAEKENRPIDGEKDIGEGINVGNSAIKSIVGPAKIHQKDKKTAITSSISEDNKRVKREAACFILSGHRLQRKEFQQMIRRLKGRVCRDSHQWSYQATHFIAPDPIRRTEKFFAATASGRWVLKTDYLTACSQAGNFLAEEPFEWHKNGLSEDGAINMGAPRRWRLLKERTGHGAFYGMRIIIYGDCIAPPLDTLKRVVKAGDGTILATSPPYTRFLDTAIDYAIVSPGMPRVDLWVQEFLKHEIPCVLADYLVEYVCKPGFSLERHVLYGTHAWAERSFANLQRRAEEIIEIPLENCEDDNDAACQLCGSRDRGDVMLICGDESGSVGCGIGTHIDCCDPPLKDVPEEDWFCPKCSGTRNCSNSPRKRKKSVSSLSNSK